MSIVGFSVRQKPAAFWQNFSALSFSEWKRLQSRRSADKWSADKWSADKYWLGLGGGIYVLFFLLFYPQMYTSVDEAATFGMIQVLRHLTIFPAVAGVILPQAMSPLGPHGHIYWFPIGFPAILAAASLIGPWAIFLVNPSLHLIATWCFARLLRPVGIPVGYAAFYLFYPGFVLYDRTLFSDGFAASLTTVALSLLAGRRERAGWAGAVLGIALLSRSLSLMVIVVLGLFLFAAEWRERERMTLWRGKFSYLLAGLAPFVVVQGLYNFYAMGSVFRSAYSAQYLTLGHFMKLGPWYLCSLLLVYPGMLVAPLRYRGLFWRESLVATLLGVLIAGSYIEATYGANFAETLIAISRQILPVMPFFLLAYCGVLAAWLPKLGRLSSSTGKILGLGLSLIAAAISVMHQRHIQQLQCIQAEINRTLPPNCVVYGSKDVFKLHFLMRDQRVYREMPFTSDSAAAHDVREHVVYVVLYLRSRGIANEDGWNQRVLNDISQKFRTEAGPPSPSGLLRYYQVIGTKPL